MVKKTKAVRAESEELQKVLDQAEEHKTKAETVRAERDTLQQQVEESSRELADAQAAFASREASALVIPSR